MDDYLNKTGDIDFDKLNSIEREAYLKALENVATAQITLEDWKKYIASMRQGAEAALVNEPEFIYSEILPFLKRRNPKIHDTIERIRIYLFFERFLTKSDLAKQALQEYNKKLGIK